MAPVPGRLCETLGVGQHIFELCLATLEYDEKALFGRNVCILRNLIHFFILRHSLVVVVTRMSYYINWKINAEISSQTLDAMTMIKSSWAPREVKDHPSAMVPRKPCQNGQDESNHISPIKAVFVSCGFISRKRTATDVAGRIPISVTMPLTNSDGVRS